MALGHGRVATNNFSCSDFIVDGGGLDRGATHTTIATALTDASSGDTIFVRPGTYTENITLKSGVNIVGFNGDGFSTVQALLSGKITLSTASDCSVKNIRIQTNADYAIEDTGATSASVRFQNCSIQVSATGGINLNNANRTLTFNNCQLSRSTNSLKTINCTAVSALTFEYCTFSGASTIAVAETNAAGTLAFTHCTMNRHAITLSGSGIVEIHDSAINSSTDNLLALDCSNTSGTCLIHGLSLRSGTAAALNIGASSTVVADDLRVQSSNATPVSGSGTFQCAGVDFFGSGNAIAAGLTWSVGEASFQTITNKSATAYAVVCGGTSTQAPLQSIAGVGSSGQVLTSNGAAALPTFQAASGGGSLVFLAKGTASASSSIVFTSEITSTYQHYVLYIALGNCATDNTDLILRLSNDAGATYESANYDSNAASLDSDPIQGATTSTSSMILIEDQGNAAGENFSLEVHLFDLEDVAKFSSYYAVGTKTNTSGIPQSTLANGQYKVAETIDAIEISMSSGNLDSGDFILYGVSE